MKKYFVSSLYVILKMKLAGITVIVLVCSCMNKQEKLTNHNTLVAEKDKCLQFIDSLAMLADTPIVGDENYSMYYTSTLTNDGKYFLSYTQLTFNTGNKKWDNQLTSFFEKEIEKERKRWVIEYSKEWPDSVPSFWQELIKCTINITPVFVSRNWVAALYHTEDYFGGAHGVVNAYFLHLYNDNGKLKRILQPDVFIYDEDSLVKQRFYTTLFSCMDNKVQWDKTSDCTEIEKQNLIGKYQIRLDLLMKPDQFAKRQKHPAYYLTPTSKGLKTQRCASWPQPKGYDTTQYIDDIIIPYRHFEGIIKQEYLNAWQNN
jgi:hypothetical protein